LRALDSIVLDKPPGGTADRENHNFGAGCHLLNLKDKFWNTKKLAKVLGKADLSRWSICLLPSGNFSIRRDFYWL
jgi:hypothetical protein